MSSTTTTGLFVRGQEFVKVVPLVVEEPASIPNQSAEVKDDLVCAGGLPHVELDVLGQLYSNTGGSNWSNSEGWNKFFRLRDISAGAPHGVVIEAQLDGFHVVEVDLCGNNLCGTLPDMRQLKKLRILKLSNNDLSGTPGNFEGLACLSVLDIAKNQFTGQLPCVAGCPKLVTYRLWGCKFSGPLPLFTENRLIENIYLGGNGGLTGELAPFFKHLSHSAVEVNLAGNQLSGTIPSIVLPRLLHLYLWGNQLEGTIPSFHGCPLKTLDVSGNDRLTGYYDEVIAYLPPTMKKLLCQDTQVVMPKFSLHHFAPDNVRSSAGMAFLVGSVLLFYVDMGSDVLALAQFYRIKRFWPFGLSLCFLLQPLLVAVYSRVHSRMDAVTKLRVGFRVLMHYPFDLLLEGMRCYAGGCTTPRFQIICLSEAIFEAFPQTLLQLWVLLLFMRDGEASIAVLYLQLGISTFVSIFSISTALHRLFSSDRRRRAVFVATRRASLKEKQLRAVGHHRRRSSIVQEFLVALSDGNADMTSLCGSIVAFISVRLYFFGEVGSRLLVAALMSALVEQKSILALVFVVVVMWRLLLHRRFDESAQQGADQQDRLDNTEVGLQITARTKFGLAHTTRLMALVSVLADSAWHESRATFVIASAGTWLELLVCSIYIASQDITGSLHLALIAFGAVLGVRAVCTRSYLSTLSYFVAPQLVPGRDSPSRVVSA